ncbi:uncharacterized protein EHS24_006675 [Apiotrichum porosum]|uniref:Pre-rRNA-processing protein TSR2 n=1 Tax=Apiotrichum porosum TaxID=105984 RepID=A0A427Y1X8_9TREE|nr:uncharacterized protein EHS24_006675 [Apiotrichum porosum]RSH85082.1 hypothetical protein EHS24_006675 [Apiotrichum porosum]
MSTPEILLFARGVVALLDLWPALTIAVREQWGGHESADKKTWLASELIDAFESAVVDTPEGPRLDPSTAAEPPLDIDQLADMLTQVMSDEFEAAIEDGSVDPLATDILRLWRDVVAPTQRPAEETVGALERKAAEVSRQGVAATSGGGAHEVDENGEEWESDSDDDEDDGVPQLVPAEEQQPREREEPIVDDDGFTLVQKPRRR